MAGKSELRRGLRARRDAFVADHRPSLRAPSEFLTRLKRGLTVASYVPVGSEADPSALARAATEAGCAIALPHVVSLKEPIRFLAWDTEAALAAGPYGLTQPAENAIELQPDIVLTPLLGFDRALNRLGQGAGHYDRAFSAFPEAWRVGVAWSVQQVDTLQADAWDMPLHAIATENEWITR